MEKIAKIVNKLGLYSNPEKNKNINSEVNRLNSLSNLLTDGYNCLKCSNRGWEAITQHENVILKKCECLSIRKNINNAKKSGIYGILNKCRLQKFATTEKFQEVMLSTAYKFLEFDTPKWLYIGGQSGCGKTHIATGICGQLLEKGKELYYAQWLEISPKIKSFGEEAEDLLRKLKVIDVLYIDDFWKTSAGVAPTPADVKISIDILNYRYINGLSTLITSELMLNEVIEIDPAIGGRIAEMCGSSFAINIAKDSNKNFRLKNLKYL